MTRSAGAHVAPELLGRYLAGDPAMTAEVEWALETHLESCAECRAGLAARVSAGQPEVTELVNGVWEALGPAVMRGRPARARPLRTRLTTWAPPAMTPWIAGALAIALCAAFLTRLMPSSRGSDLMVLLAPVVPVFGVAAAWSKALDPMYELVVATARAGLLLLLRRTLTALVVVLPVLAAASALVGISPLLWLLPCLVCVLASLALGSVIGVERATPAVAGVWLLAFTPVLFLSGRAHPLGLLNTPVWTVAAGLVAVLAAAVIVLRGNNFTRVLNDRIAGGL